jgi:hypothetical protein
MMPFDNIGVMIFSPKLFFSHGKLNISILECNLYNGINISVDHDFIKQVVYHEMLSYKVQLMYMAFHFECLPFKLQVEGRSAC